MAEKTPTNKYAVPALDKGLDIIEYLASQESPRSQAEISTALGRSANEIYRVLVGLEARGYLYREEVSGKYRISLKLYNLSRRISPVHKVRQFALPHMEDLAFSTGCSCYLTMLYQSQTMVIVHASSHEPVSLSIAEGTLISTMSTCPGKILLANSKPEVSDMILERDSAYQNMSQAKQEALAQELTDIREQGFVLAPSPFVAGAEEYSTLIGQPEGLVIASLSISSMPSPLNDKVDAEELINKLQEAAAKITVQLGC
ncbi:IclR family transcriptional regulator [Vibrio sp. WXL103]|uniref:IclR family transcriptional regulator n=1 Tax=unclassified Vibrio TaxID=2614977 RepID=UPI003EC5CF7E